MLQEVVEKNVMEWQVTKKNNSILLFYIFYLYFYIYIYYLLIFYILYFTFKKKIFC